MGLTIKSGQAYITATPSSQDSQVLRVRASSDYTAYTINANSSGSAKYDWIYLKVDATKANDPASDASDVTSIYTSRSSSNTTDNGTPPTYGILLAVVAVANGASSITNSNITDKRFNTSIGAQNGSLIVQQQATGDAAIIEAAGQDANIGLTLSPKGTGTVNLPSASVTKTNIDSSTFPAMQKASSGTGSSTTLTIPAKGVVIFMGMGRIATATATVSMSITGTAVVSSNVTASANDSDYVTIPCYGVAYVQAGSITGTITGSTDNNSIVGVYLPIVTST
jgi:hypothetical protein